MGRGQTFLPHLPGDSSVSGMQYKLPKCLFNEWRNKWNVVQIEKLIFNRQSTLFGKDKLSKYGIFKRRNTKRVSIGEQAGVLPEESSDSQIRGPGEPRGSPSFAYSTAQLQADSGPCLQQPWPLQPHLIPLGKSLWTLSHTGKMWT